MLGWASLSTVTQWKAKTIPTNFGIRTDPPASLSRSIALFRAFLVEQTDPDHFYSLLAADSVRQVGGVHRARRPGVPRRRRRPGLLPRRVHRGGGALPGAGPGRRRTVRQGRAAARHDPRQRHRTPCSERVRGRLLLVQRARARRDAGGDARRDGPGDPARRHGVRRRSRRGCRRGVVTRPRRGTTWVATTPGGGICGGPGTNRRTNSGKACSRSPSVPRCGGRGRQRKPISCAHSRVTTRGGRSGSCTSRFCGKSPPGILSWSCASVKWRWQRAGAAAPGRPRAGPSACGAAAGAAAGRPARAPRRR